MKSSKGFTIIELVVVMAVFLFIIGAAISIFLSVISSQKKILSEQQFLNQVSYAEEYMSKALRMAEVAPDGNACGIPAGYIYLLVRQSSSSTYTGVKFVNSDGSCQEFSWDKCDSSNPNSSVLCETKNNGIPTTNGIPITSTKDFQITSAIFSVNGKNGTVNTQNYPGSIPLVSCSGYPDQCGTSNADDMQPKVTILLNLAIAGEPTKTIQTTISQRDLNVNHGQRP